VTDRTSEFDDIYRRHAADVYRFALWLSGDRSEADDITSETFVRALASSEPIRAATVRGYLLTIARHYFLETRRKTSRQLPLTETLPDPRPEPNARAEQASELAAVHAALARLPEIDRAAIIMRAVHEMPYDEIASTLGLSVAAAKVKVHRARLALAALR
jgi:RNA polymerase sigma-70 factor, ECF subfamily